MRTIPQRELRNNIGRVLREVEAGEYLRVTVDGRPVADLVPIEDARHRFVPREVVEEILHTASADPGLARDLDEALGDTIDRL
jgi:prevent-host-death family protein